MFHNLMIIMIEIEILLYYDEQLPSYLLLNVDKLKLNTLVWQIILFSTKI